LGFAKRGGGMRDTIKFARTCSRDVYREKKVPTKSRRKERKKERKK